MSTLQENPISAERREATRTFLIDRVSYGGLTLRSRTPLILEPVIDDSGQLLCIERDDLGIDVFAPTRNALLTELNEQLIMLWREYALAENDTLDTGARELKQALLATFAETHDAA